MKSVITPRVLILVFVVLLSQPERIFAACNTTACNQLTNARLRKQNERRLSFDRIRSRFHSSVGTENFILHKNTVELPFDVLIAKLQSRELKAVDVLSAFLDKAINATDAFNCVTEFVPGAMARAQELDKSPTIKGPLHGLPVCFKDNIDIKGMDSTLGYSKL
ncbi:unnamed protein product, partial [Allacma fusca]